MAFAGVPGDTLDFIFQQVAQQFSRQMDDVDSLTTKGGVTAGVIAGLFAAVTASQVTARPGLWSTIAVALLCVALLFTVAAISPTAYRVVPRPRTLFTPQYLGAELPHVLLRLGHTMVGEYERNERTLKRKWTLLSWGLACAVVALVIIAVTFMVR